MDAITRRRFLIASGVTAGAALAGGAGFVTYDQLLSRDDPPGPAHDTAGTARILVHVTLYGGNDGLNTVVPASDPAYRSARPELAFQEADVLPLADGLSLAPSMKGFKKLWDDRRLAVVNGVSYPKPDHSHFKSMAIWQTAAPESPKKSGWLGRWLDTHGADPMTAIGIGPALPPMLVGEKCAGACLPMTGFTLAKKTSAAIPSLARASRSDVGLAARATKAYADLQRARTTFGPALEHANQPSATNPSAPASADPSAVPSDEKDAQGATTGGNDALSQQLAVVAECLKARVPTRVYSVSLGGFDTHADELGTQEKLIGQVDSAVSGFLAAVEALPLGKQVVVLVHSEFGRRVRANANQGTDHGTAGPVLVAGAPVAGGMYGEHPSLTDLDDGDLKWSVDFRDVYATVLDKVLGADPGPIVGAGRTPLAFL